MNNRLKSLSYAVVGAIASTVLATAVKAEPMFKDYPTTYQPFAEEFMRAASRTSGDVFKNKSLLGQMSTYLGVSFPWPNGINGFPETLMTNDARLVNQLYRDGMLRQTSSDPIIRTADLINPYSTSILTQPSYRDLDLQTAPGLPVQRR
ncbi:MULTISPECIES: hypothetical protein [Planktothrix]|jgi:hypothetical protein|uniref:Uncharacterized protein n=4 Tax=Planktothrix TaxID=54304 RepID=A0A073CUJ2_PLAA1|nr:MULTISPECIES: hypothetical protein [Planktothrix]MCF3606566.1 hypothetical protein [Planktothrix agardhii 1033]CAD5960821.1 hypothetical protein NO108_03530 [Planktothrix rubescens]BBD56548.1 hypothetical protein NIES204_38780 [Planktothrix agardhii NIES-204]KEI67675.1 hypothetical protein A19Y_2803 [Planktothrix agardhii NIVA-CYA 126/8]MBG0746434.1 hypothetical protein [Planktothrix agardhii KL2]